MKCFIFFLSGLSLLFFWSCNEEVSVIEGDVKNAAFEGQKVYLVASDAPVTKNVDSVFIENGSFRFESPPDSQIYKVVRIPAQYPDVVQDLIVIPEKGVVSVKMAQKSKGKGTPLNNKMQKWKERKQEYDSIQWSIYQQKKELELTKLQVDSLNEYASDTKDMFLDEVMCFVEQNLNNGIGLFLFKIYFHSFPADFKNEILQKKRELYFNKDKQLEKIISQ